MAEYTLYYWPIPFRGQFVRAVLAHVHATWDERSAEEIYALKDQTPSIQSVPHMGPPVLTDHEAKASISQTQAILAYLGRKYDLIPKDRTLEALSHKIIADANDILYEMTLYNGAQMWTRESWSDYLPRLRRWMEMFEDLGRRHGLTRESGTILGTKDLSIADFTTHILWGTMTDKLPALRPVLEEAAPKVASLSDRIAGLPEQKELRTTSDEAYGEEWCSGQIEASLRAVI